MSNPFSTVYIVSGRRSALGRPGGLHRNRRIEQLAAPVLSAALDDAGLRPADVDEIILGNGSQGGNPARLIALAAGLNDNCPALTVDRQCASGLEAILSAMRRVALGEADIVVAGGAESLSTAPWRLARPRASHLIPHFLDFGGQSGEEIGQTQLVQASEALARRLHLPRQRQDAYALMTRMRATAAFDAERFVGEIVPLKLGPGEARDEGLMEIADEQELAEMPAFDEASGTVTPGNMSVFHDGAAFVTLLSEAAYERLGRPPALRLIGSASVGIAPELEAKAPVDATELLFKRMNGFRRNDIRFIELSETSAAQALAFADALGIDEALLNPDGGALARGHPFGASGAVLVVRLFSHLVRRRDADTGGIGIAAIGAIGGLGVAAAFEGV